MTQPAFDDRERTVELLLGLLQRNRSGKSPEFHIGRALAEFDAWLADDRQWHHGRPQHWRGLLDDLLGQLQVVTSLSDAPTQQQLDKLAGDLRTLRKGFGGANVVPDEALRRGLRRVGVAIRAIVEQPELLLSAWRRIATWVHDDPQRADEMIGALRDLAELCGHDSADILDQMSRVLADNAATIAIARGGDVPDDLRSVANMPAADRFLLAESLLSQSARKVGPVVWLEYLQARLNSPPTLSLGPAVTLYRHDFLRSIIHQAPSDDRVPEELREGPSRASLAIWLHAYDPDEAVRADHAVHGDPRVFLRVELDAMPPTRLLSAARETAEFLVAFGSLSNDHDGIWVLGDSFFIPGYKSSKSAFAVSLDKGRMGLDVDATAADLALSAASLGRHLPLRTHSLQVAGRLLVWLRQAATTDNPARIVLSDRVVEQVCGWAGISQPPRFVEEYLKPAWVYQQIRSAVLEAYWLVRDATRGELALRTVIEVPSNEPPHSAGNHAPSMDLKAVLERLDDLIAAAPPDSEAAVRVTALKQRIADPPAVAAWLDQLDAEFDRRARRLRRTRNALMHGGPIVRTTVDDVARFSATLAYLALGPAVHLLLDEQDVVDGFLDRQQRHLRCFSLLRSGTPASQALFWQT